MLALRCAGAVNSFPNDSIFVSNLDLLSRRQEMQRIKHETMKLTRFAHAWKPEASSFVDKMLAPVLPVNWPGTNFELAQADI